MSLTPHRAAVTATAEVTRRQYAEVLARDDAHGIGQRMYIEAAEAVLGGVADMMDRAFDTTEIWPQVGQALAGALSAFLLSTARGDAGQAIHLLPGAIASIHELAIDRLRQGPEAFIEGPSVDEHPAGCA